MTTDTTRIPDLRPVLTHAFDVADGLVNAIGATDLDRATPCDEYDVRALTEHLVMVARRIRIVLGGGHFTEAVAPAADTLDELRAAWTASVAELKDALPAVDLGRTVTAPFGSLPAAAAVGTYVGEVVVHAWDLARALDRDDLLDPALAEPLVEPARRNIPEEREGIPFGEVVDVPDDAPAYDRLVGWFGRDPHWTPPAA